MTSATNARETLVEDQFRIEEHLELFGRPVGCMIIGSWKEDGACEAMVGVMALEPFDFCRLVAAARFVPGEGGSVVRATEKDDPRDDQCVIERFFDRPLGEIMVAAFLPLGGALAAAAKLREERAGEMPVREMPAPVWVH
jgi:hypothetical protein